MAGFSVVAATGAVLLAGRVAAVYVAVVPEDHQRAALDQLLAEN